MWIKCEFALKVAISHLGEIKNCLYLKENFGNYKYVSIAEAIETNEFQRLWHVSKNNIKVCQSCEYRYACMDCRAFVEDSNDPFSKPLKCFINDEKN